MLQELGNVVVLLSARRKGINEKNIAFGIFHGFLENTSETLRLILESDSTSGRGRVVRFARPSVVDIVSIELLALCRTRCLPNVI